MFSLQKKIKKIDKGAQTNFMIQGLSCFQWAKLKVYKGLYAREIHQSPVILKSCIQSQHAYLWLPIQNPEIINIYILFSGKNQITFA